MIRERSKNSVSKESVKKLFLKGSLWKQLYDRGWPYSRSGFHASRMRACSAMWREAVQYNGLGVERTVTVTAAYSKSYRDAGCNVGSLVGVLRLFYVEAVLLWPAAKITVDRFGRWRCQCQRRRSVKGATRTAGGYGLLYLATCQYGPVNPAVANQPLRRRVARPDGRTVHSAATPESTVTGRRIAVSGYLKPGVSMISRTGYVASYWGPT